MKIFDSIKSAFSSIWSNKVRSVLTVLGIVIGVSAVTILVSLGQGLKSEVSDLIQGFGSNVMVVIGGKVSGSGGGIQSNPANLIAGDIVTQKDVDTIEKVNGVDTLSPLSPISGNLRNGNTASNTITAGAYPTIASAFEVLKIKDGQMFQKKNSGNVIVLGPVVKTTLFGDSNAVGQKVQLGKQELTVVGVFDKAKGSGPFGSEFDSFSVIPFDTATMFNKNQVKIFRVAVKAKSDAKVKDVKEDIRKAILANHNGQEDFSVLTQDDILGLFDQFLNLATTLVSGIAAISLLVGGIGIMNIMLVTVTERTKEIGLRKAVGATKLDIGLQFLVEAIMVTLFGGFIGLGISFGVSRIIAAKTPLTPLITPDVILIALSVSTIVGVIFGLWPALRAANKDPIEALRYE